jgi:cytochrome c-type biogenesis protein CcmH
MEFLPMNAGRKILNALILAFFLLMFSLPVYAQDAGPTKGSASDVTDNEVNAVAKQLYCPVCENIPLDVCPTQACEEWRGLIREKLADGWSESQIKQYFADQYGDRVLGAPPPRGLNLIGYIFLVGVILIIAAVLLGAMVIWKRQTIQKQVAVEKQTPTPDDEYVQQLEKELRKRN